LRFGRVSLAVCFAIVALPGSALAAASTNSLEYAVKATFLYKFAGFVNWPPAAFESSSSPFVLCVLGDDPVAATIDMAAAGQQVSERTIAVRHLQTVDRDTRCHILYIAANIPPADAEDAVRGLPVLTVTDTRRTGKSIVSFVVDNNRVRFDIDEAAAAENGLAISSKLLSLARTVRPRP
jgi:hypothetical protein